MILTLLLGTVAFGVLALLSLLPAIEIQKELVRAKVALEAGREAFLGGHLTAARRSFDEAASSFIQARSRVDTPFLTLAASVPLAGRTPDSIVAMATAGASVAGAGSELATAISRLPGGLGALAPDHGQIPMAVLRQLRPVLRSVSDNVGAATHILSAAERTWVLPPVADARRQFEPPLEALNTALRSAAAVAGQLPRFLGENGERRYFVAAQNPAELRGTGGFIGSWAILYANRGRIRFSTFNSIARLPDAVGEVPPPNPDFAERYEGFGGAGFWRNINVTPDFPSAAVAIERLFQKVSGVRIHGVIGTDPQALAALLAATGPVDVPALETRLDASNVVAFTTNRAYSQIEDQERRRQVLGEAAKATFDRFVEGTRNPVAAVQALTAAVATGHVAFHSTDEVTQAAFMTANVGGGLLSPAGDFVAVSATNSAGNKLDYYVHRSIRYQVGLNEDGSAASNLRVGLDNRSPDSGQPQYVIGPYPGASARGESVSYLSAYCGADCELREHTIDGVAAPVGVEREIGHRVFSEFVRIPAGSSTTLGYELAVPHAWLGDGLSGRYRVTIQDQPSAINPTSITVEIHTPPGTSVSATNVPMDVEGGVARWTGSPGKSVRLEVEFEKSLIVRAWSRFVRFLVKPLA
ncbi:MAG: DUF4012 domain-containing protein [Actinobacteria bacterium]|nr:DUF4012 domain-containing protein [Actinomycetota bacterium]